MVLKKFQKKTYPATQSPFDKEQETYRTDAFAELNEIRRALSVYPYSGY